MADENNNNEGGENTKPTLKDLITEHGLQDELNNMMADNRRNLTKQNQDLVNQLEQLKQNTRLTQDERDDLQSRINQLEEQYMSKEELAKREAAKAQKQYEQNIKNVTEERERWQNMYTSETIDRSLQDAAVEGEALHPTQIVEILRNKTQLVEGIEEGKPTGRYHPVIKFNDKNEDGQPVVLELSPVDAIKRMKELPELYGNLFKSTATSGLGESSAGGELMKSPSFNELMKDPVKYAEWRKKNPDLDITKLRR